MANSDDVNYLYSMFGDLNKSVVETIYHANGKDIDKAVDEILNFGAGQDKTGAIDLSNSLFLRSALNPEEEFLKGEAERRKRLQSEASREHTEKLEREARQRIEEAERKRVEEERRLQQDLKLKLEREAKLRAEEAERRRIEEEKQIQEQQRLELELLRAEMEARKSVEREAQEARQQAEARIKEMNIRLEEEKRKKEEIERLANQRFQEVLEQRAVAEALEKQALEQRLAVEAEKQKLAELTRIEKERLELARQQLEREELAQQEKERAELARIEEERARVAKEAEERAELERKEAEEVQRRKEAESARKFSIYTRQTQDSQQAQDIIVNQMKELLLSNLICVESEIALIDISCDFELARYLKDVSGGEKFPLLTFQDKPIGNLEQLSALLRDEDKVAKLRQGEYDGKVELKDGTGIIVGQGALDHCLDAAEYVISGVGSLLWLPVSIVTWPFRSEKAGLSKGPNDVDFEIVHTNWYWRNLKRRFRFGAESILRIHPVHQDVRATHPYSTIKCVKLIDSKNIVIEYADSSSPDYIQAVEKDIELMVQLLRSRCADNKEPTEFITAPTPVPSAIEN